MGAKDRRSKARTEPSSHRTNSASSQEKPTNGKNSARLSRKIHKEPRTEPVFERSKRPSLTTLFRPQPSFHAPFMALKRTYQPSSTCNLWFSVQNKSAPSLEDLGESSR